MLFFTGLGPAAAWLLARPQGLWVWGLVGVVCDLMIGTALVLLLICPNPMVPKPLRRWIPWEGERLKRILIGLTVVGYLSLSPVFLLLFIQQFWQQ